MARVFLDPNETRYIVASPNTTVYGNGAAVAAGIDQTVVLMPSAGTVNVDQNIGRVNLGGTVADYTFRSVGNILQVYDATKTKLLISIDVQADHNGTILGLEDRVFRVELDMDATSETAGQITIGSRPIPPAEEENTPTVEIPPIKLEDPEPAPDVGLEPEPVPNPNPEPTPEPEPEPEPEPTPEPAPEPPPYVPPPPADTTPPAMASAAVSADGKTIVITYSEAIKGSPTIEDYAISINNVSAIIKDAALSGNTVTLTLDARIPKENVTINSITYTKGEDASIEDNSNNLADTQTLSASITNNSAVTDVTKYTANIANVLNGLTDAIVDATGMTGAQLVEVHGKLSNVDKIIGELIIKHSVPLTGSPVPAEALYQKFRGHPEDVWADASTYNGTGVEGLVNNTTIPKIVGIGSGSYANNSSAGHQTFSFAADKLHGRELLGLEEGGFNSKITVTGLESKPEADLSGIGKGTPNVTIEGAIATGSNGNTITLTGNLGKAFITITGDGTLDVTGAGVADATFIMGTGTATLNGATEVNLIDKDSDLDNAFNSLNDNSVLVDATDMDPDALKKVLTNIDKVKAIIGNLHLVHDLADSKRDANTPGTKDSNFQKLLAKYSGGNVTATANDMTLGEVRVLYDYRGKIAEKGIDGAIKIQGEAGSWMGSSNVGTLLTKLADGATATVVANTFHQNGTINQTSREGLHNSASQKGVTHISELNTGYHLTIRAENIDGKTVNGTAGKITITYMNEKLDADLSKIGINSGGNIEVIAQTTNAGDITFNGKLGVATFNILGTSQVTMEATAEFNNASFGIAAASTLILAHDQTGPSVSNKITGAGTLKITGTANADTIDLSGMDLSGFTGTTYITPSLDAGVADTITLKAGQSKDIIEVTYLSSVKPTQFTDTISDDKFSATDVITYGNGVDVITNFQAGANGDVLKVMSQYYRGATLSSALDKAHASGLVTNNFYFLSGAYDSSGKAFTVAEDGVGTDTLVLIGHSAPVDTGLPGTNIANNYSSVILVGVDSDDLTGANFMSDQGNTFNW